MNRFDAIVIGAGPAGATAALSMARAGLSVALVEKGEFPRYKVCGEYVSTAAWSILDALGVGSQLAPHAGPPVRAIGLYAGDTRMEVSVGRSPLGRAIGRHLLDESLRDAAAAAGATLFQPCSAENLERIDDEWQVTIAPQGDTTLALRAPIVVAAHGSWMTGPLPTQRAMAQPRRPLLGFKARFLRARLPVGVMPLLLFRGGYGGLVHSDGGAVSLSFCVHADSLAQARSRYPGVSAGEAAYREIAGEIRAVREVLQEAAIERAWMGAGPIRPGFRTLADDGLFAVGNAAGEAHPLVAEGITMGIESGALLGEMLRSWRGDVAALRAIERDYARRWRRAIASRIVASLAYERITAAAPGLTARVAATLPSVFASAARWSGKGRPATA